MALVEAAYMSAREKVKVALADITRGEEKSGSKVNTELIRQTNAQSQAPEERGFFARLFSKPEPLAEARPFDAELFENFSPRAQQVLTLARKEAERFNHHFVGTEHVLLGLIKLGQGVAVNVLQKMGIDLDSVRMEVERQVGTGPDKKAIGNIPYTPRVKRVLALAAKEAKALTHTYVGTEHILLGLRREGDGVAARVLKSLKVDLDMTRQEILKELDPNFQLEERISRWEEPISKADELLSRSEEAILGAEEPILNLNPHAQQALAFARKEADRFNHNFIGTEHLLLALVRLDVSVAVTVLKKQGTSLEAIRKEVEKQIGPELEQKVIGNIPYTPRIKRVLALAAKEAKALNHTYVGTEHILLGLIREGDGVAARVLKDLGVELEKTREEILKELDPDRT
jgi:ATP-dependent Clp protease ATP-binding subunit ClpA